MGLGDSSEGRHVLEEVRRLGKLAYQQGIDPLILGIDPRDFATDRAVLYPVTLCATPDRAVVLTLGHDTCQLDSTFGAVLIVKNLAGGAHTATIQGALGVDIDGASSLVLDPGQTAILIAGDVGSWRAIARIRGGAVVTAQAATGALTDSTGGTPAASVVATTAATTASGVSLEADLTGADTVDKTKTQANFAAIGTELGKLRTDGLAATAALGHANDDVASLAAKVNALRTELIAAGVLT